jgi:hypothetical protein
MADSLQKNGLVSAKLHSIEENFAYFVLNTEEQDLIQWPLNQLPEGIDIGDEVKISIDFELAEEKKAQIIKRTENEAKYQNMRKMLEELVN